MFRRQTTICREGWYYLAIVALVFGGATLKEVNLLLILAGMLLGPLLLNWRAVRATLRGLDVRRTLPPRISAGDFLAIDLSLTNTRRRWSSWAVVVEDRVQQEPSNGSQKRLSPLKPRLLFSYVRPSQSRKLGYRGVLLERGRYRFGPLSLTTRFPFGLFSRTIQTGPTESVLVLPRLGRLTHAWSARPFEAFAGRDLRRRRPGPEGDVYGVREWRSGDAARLIHWRTSARLGKLTVRQFERQRSRDMAVLLDLWLPTYGGATQEDNVELAVSFAATVLTDVCRLPGSNVYLALRNGQVECHGGAASPTLLQALLEQLALVHGQAEEVLPELFAAALRRITAGTEIVIVGTRPTDLAELLHSPRLRGEPGLRDSTRRIRCIDTSSERLAELFQAE